MPSLRKLFAGLVLLVAAAFASAPARAQHWEGATLVGGDYCPGGVKELGMAFKNIRICATTENYVGSIFLSAFGRCPPETLEATGQSLPVNGNTLALHSLYNAKFGGDGVTNFKLPDLRGHPPVAHNDASKEYLRYCVLINGYYPARDAPAPKLVCQFSGGWSDRIDTGDSGVIAIGAACNGLKQVVNGVVVGIPRGLVVDIRDAKGGEIDDHPGGHRKSRR